MPVPQNTDSIKRLNYVTQETRARIIRAIVGHPTHSPSLHELAYQIPEKSRSTIRDHLLDMIDREVVEPITLPEDQRSRDLPWKFYTLSEETFELFTTTGIFVDEWEEIRNAYSLETERPRMQTEDKVRAYQEAPRPDELYEHAIFDRD